MDIILAGRILILITLGYYLVVSLMSRVDFGYVTGNLSVANICYPAGTGDGIIPRPRGLILLLLVKDRYEVK